MPETGSGGANRIELESQILCASMRQSWALEDTEGVVTVARQLYQLFPDLLPPLKPGNNKIEADNNFYDLLEIRCDAPQTTVIARYLHAVKRYLVAGNIKEFRNEYYRLLDAGYILRKPRLRLSHDLVIIRRWLMEKDVIPKDGTIDFMPTVTGGEPAQLLSTQQITPHLPMLVQLLREAQIIGPAEVQALSNQMNIAPEIPAHELVLSAGYVTDLELKSLQLAEFLLSQGKITMPQFMVAMYDERTQGIRMAESLQIRGWLETEGKAFKREAK
jgi:hypothetical protein